MLTRWAWFTDYSGASKLDWCIAMQTCGLGLFIGLPFKSMQQSPALVQAAATMPEYCWAWMFGLAGGALIYVLHIDHRTGLWTTAARALLLLATMAAYLFFGMQFIHTVPHSPGTFIFLSMALLSCGAAFVASCRDVGRSIGERKRGDD